MAGTVGNSWEQIGNSTSRHDVDVGNRFPPAVHNCSRVPRCMPGNREQMDSTHERRHLWITKRRSGLVVRRSTGRHRRSERTGSHASRTDIRPSASSVATPWPQERLTSAPRTRRLDGHDGYVEQVASSGLRTYVRLASQYCM